jgi:hypothetical protein
MMNKVESICNDFQATKIEGKLDEIYPYGIIEREIKSLAEGWNSHAVWMETGKKFGFLDSTGNHISNNLEKNIRYNKLINTWNDFVDSRNNKGVIQKISDSVKNYSDADAWCDYIGINKLPNK